MNPKNILKINIAPALLLTLLLIIFSCKKDDHEIKPPPPPPENMPLIKEIVIQNLPSPFFRFDYNADSTAKEISFASGQSTYLVNYVDGKISNLTNVKQPTKLYYFHTGENVSRIRTDNVLTGKTVWSNTFKYDNWNRLEKIVWYKFAANGVDSTKFRETNFAYHNNHNLASYEQYRLQDDGSFPKVSSAWYNDYDQGINVDDINVYKEFFEDFLYLPGVRLMINNPKTLHWKAGDNEYLVNYSYEYQDRMPTRKLSKFHQTKGDQAGKKTQSWTQYFYH